MDQGSVTDAGSSEDETDERIKIESEDDDNSGAEGLETDPDLAWVVTANTHSETANDGTIKDKDAHKDGAMEADTATGTRRLVQMGGARGENVMVGGTVLESSALAQAVPNSGSAGNDTKDDGYTIPRAHPKARLQQVAQIQLETMWSMLKGSTLELGLLRVMPWTLGHQRPKRRCWELAESTLAMMVLTMPSLCVDHAAIANPSSKTWMDRGAYNLQGGPRRL